MAKPCGEDEAANLGCKVTGLKFVASKEFAVESPLKCNLALVICMHILIYG